MKRGFPYEKPGRRYAWAIANRGGYLLSDIRGLKKELIVKIEAEWNMPWRTIRRRYGLRIVWVEIRIISE